MAALKNKDWQAFYKLIGSTLEMSFNIGIFSESLGRTVAKWKLLSSPVFCFWLGYQHDYIYYCTYTNGFGLFSQRNSDLCLQMKVISVSFIASIAGLCQCTCALCCTGNRDREKRVKENPFTFIIWCTLPFKGLELVWLFWKFFF